MNDKPDNDPRLFAIPDIHGHAKGEHKAYTDERPIPLSARMLFLWFYHACRRGWPRFLMVTDHMNYLTFEDPAAINLVRRALKLAQAGDLYGAAETASVEVNHAAVVSDGLRRGMRYSIGAEVDNDPRSRPDAQNIVDAMKPDGMVRSVHFLTIDHPAHGPNWNWPFDNPEFADVYDIVGTEKTWELYMATLLDAVERLPGNIVGHFYVPAVFGHWPDDATLERYEDQIVAACEERGLAIEFNTRFLYRPHSDEEKAKYLAAHRRLLTKCKERNVGIAVGSDAHSPKDQGAGFATVLALLDECEINELVFPIAGRLLRVALRVERKAEAVVEPIRSEERKPARKAVRPSAVGEAAEATPDAEPTAGPAVAPPEPPVKSKPKPKRARAKTAAPEEVDTADQAAVALDPSAEDALAEASAAPETEPVAAESPEPEPPAAAAQVLAETPAEPVADAEPAPAQIDAALAAEALADAAPTPEPEPDQTAAAPPQPAPTMKSGAARKSKAVPLAAKSAVAPPPAKAAAVPAAHKPKLAAAKAPAKKSPAAKAPAKKSAPKKAAPKRAVEKKAPAKKAAVRAASAKKSTAKKSAAKKAAPKKPAQRRR